MHKNTFFLVLILAVIAALLVGVNIGRKFSPPQEVKETFIATPIPTQSLQTTTFSSPSCGITLTLPPGTTATAVATNGAQFVSPDSSVVLFACEKEISKIALPAEKIETIQIASISAKLYHTTSPKDAAPIDVLLFRNPEKTMDVYLAGLGSTFSAIIRSITILPQLP